MSGYTAKTGATVRMVVPLEMQWVDRQAESSLLARPFGLRAKVWLNTDDEWSWALREANDDWGPSIQHGHTTARTESKLAAARALAGHLHGSITS